MSNYAEAKAAWEEFSTLMCGLPEEAHQLLEVKMADYINSVSIKFKVTLKHQAVVGALIQEGIVR